MHTEERGQSAKEKAATTLLFFSIVFLMKKAKQNKTEHWKKQFLFWAGLYEKRLILLSFQFSITKEHFARF